MIRGVFVPLEEKEAPRLLFRGRSLDFWIPLCFPGIPFHESPPSPVEEPDMLLVCHPLCIASTPESSRALSDWVERLGKEGRSLLVHDGAMGILPRRAWSGGAVPEGEMAAPPFPLDFLRAQQTPAAVEDRIVRLQLEWLAARGVTVEDRRWFFMEGLVPVGRDSVIGPGVVLRGDTRIGQGVRIHSGCVIENSVIGDGCHLLPGCVISDSSVEKDARVGPYTHLRMQARVGPDTRVGNFVEIKKSVLGKGSKASHLTYLGDARIGGNVNIGAGTITCNYDGFQKHPTTIEDGVFVGSGTELVAPIRLERDSYVAAGSTITQDLPADSLGIARQRQRTILGWRLRKKAKVKD